MPPVRLSVLSVQLMRPVDEAVVMVRSRSTVRFRNGAPGHRQFSNESNGVVERAPETLLGSHCTQSTQCKSPAAAREGSRRRADREQSGHRPGEVTLGGSSSRRAVPASMSRIKIHGLAAAAVVRLGRPWE